MDHEGDAERRYERGVDRDHLRSLGYAQELHRGMSHFSNFAISFSIISILAGLASFWLGLVTGGPMAITLGWVIVGFFALLVGMGMGAICSAYPTAGGVSHRRWPVLLVGEAGEAQPCPMGVVHRLFQPGRPDRDHRQRRLRPGHLRRLRRRCDDHRPGAVRRAVEHPGHQRRLRPRAVARPVHHRWVRCLRTRERGDQGRPHRSTQGHRALDLHPGHRRVDPQPRPDRDAAQGRRRR